MLSRPRPSARILAYSLAGLFGLVCVAIGASWFIAGKGALVAGFPSSRVEAVACGAGGLAVIFWAAARILREITRQRPSADRSPPS